MAYAAVVSLARILDQLLHSDQYAVQYPKPQIESLYGKICLLQSSFEEIFPLSKSRSDVNDLEIRIRDVIYKAQDTVESFIYTQIRASESEEIPGHRNSSSVLVQDLEEITAKLDLITGTPETLRRSIRQSPKGARRRDLTSEEASNFRLSGMRTMIVGRDEDLMLLKARLMDGTSQLEVITITGLPGVGKTALAKSVFEDSHVQEYFHILCWATVSEEYHVEEILRDLLRSTGWSGEIGEREHRMERMERMYKNLKGRRYLIVMDDIWDENIWDDVRRCFPGDNNGSRIILTTRNAAIANFGYSFVMRPLDQETSWTLLRRTVFGNENCPRELEDIGRNIAEKCGGVPLSIVVVGGLLSKVIRTVECWKSIEDDVHGAAAQGGMSYLEILSLSYNNLPSRLKACFLYMGAFPKDGEILVSKLTKLWVAEGFLTPPSSPSKSLEKVAEQHLRDLIDRNLISVCKITFDGQPKTCSMQDNLRQLAIEECQKEKFFHTINRYVQELSEGTESERRVSVHNNILMCTEDVYHCTKSIKLARTLLYAGTSHYHPLPFCLTFDLLRVLDALTVYFIELPDALFELIHLRYLAFTYDEDLPPSISKLRNLLILIVRQHPKIILRRTLIVPVEIWKMPGIRHLLFDECFLPDPSGAEIHAHNSVLLENLQSLSNVNVACCTKEILQNMPNLKKLGIWTEAPGAVHFELDLLQHLEAFKFTVLKPIPEQKIDFLPKLVFPMTLKKLSLRGCGVPWEDMTIVGQLPCLEVLKLRELAFQGPEWCPIDGEFRKLKFLLLESLDLKKWDADGSHFRSLERLIIRHCYELEGFICDLYGVKLIELIDCNPAAVECAQRMRDELEDCGYDDLQLRIHSAWE